MPKTCLKNQETSTCRTAGHVAAGSSGSDLWEYNTYRASLRLNGKPFAILTPDGRNALDTKSITKLLNTLNRPNSEISNAPTSAERKAT
jgi:hypothetical protein